MCILCSKVQVVEKIEMADRKPVIKYTVPDKYGDTETDCEYEDSRFYLPTAGWPMFGIKLMKGTLTRVKYTMRNTEGPSPPPCILDFPQRLSDNLYQVGHCPNLVRENKITQSMTCPMESRVSRRRRARTRPRCPAGTSWTAGFTAKKSKLRS